MHGDKTARGHKTARRVIFCTKTLLHEGKKLHGDTFARGDKAARRVIIARAHNFARWFMHEKINKK